MRIELLRVFREPHRRIVVIRHEIKFAEKLVEIGSVLTEPCVRGDFSARDFKLYRHCKLLCVHCRTLRAESVIVKAQGRILPCLRIGCRGFNLRNIAVFIAPYSRSVCIVYIFKGVISVDKPIAELLLAHITTAMVGFKLIVYLPCNDRRI